MKKQCFLFLLYFLAAYTCFAQNAASYRELVQTASQLYDSKQYIPSAKKYSEAFAVKDAKITVWDYYNAACSWALANEVDSAFHHLSLAVSKGKFSSYDHLLSDTDLNNLHKDHRWEMIKTFVKENQAVAEAKYDRPLMAHLDSIYDDDQHHRMMIDSVSKAHGWDSPQLKELWKTIAVLDSINLIKVTKVLDERGWLGRDIVGGRGNSTLFLVIQHADLAVQEKYLPMMRDAVQKGNANPSSLALLEDRVALRQGKRQLYGSQIGRDPATNEYYVLPLDDPDNVDARRASMGLGKLQDYVSQWKIKWDPTEYKKQLPMIEEREKSRN